MRKRVRIIHTYILSKSLNFTLTQKKKGTRTHRLKIRENGELRIERRKFGTKIEISKKKS